MNAAICLFTFTRADCLKMTISALQRCSEAKESDLFIFCDGPRFKTDIPAIKTVHAMVADIEGFASVTVTRRKTNFGLALNIEDGVSEVVRQYGRVIVLEDDIVVAPNFLAYMNTALEKYERTSSVWHIAGWTVPQPTSSINGYAYFTKVMNCWGWATWADRWQYFKRDPKELTSEWTDEQIHSFDLEGSGIFWSQVQRNLNGSLTSWAVFWYATIYRHHGLCLAPPISLIENVGITRGGENFKPKRRIRFHRPRNLSPIHFPLEIVVRERLWQRTIEYYGLRKRSRFVRLVVKLKYHFGL
jgi:hypothetical protein